MYAEEKNNRLFSLEYLLFLIIEIKKLSYIFKG